MGATFNTTMIMKKNNLTLLSRKSIPTLATVTAAVLLAMSPRPARAAAFAGLAAKTALGLDTFVAGELCKFVGLGFPLRPRGLEEVLQVEVEIRDVAHE